MDKIIKEDYVSNKVARLLKEKGFDVPCRAYYDMGALKEDITVPSDWSHSVYIDHTSAPTLQMAMKWLREVHNKHCNIGYDLDLYWFFRIIEMKELKEHFDYSELKYYHTENETGFNTYEEAVEAAIKYCLENLIK